MEESEGFGELLDREPGVLSAALEVDVSDLDRQVEQHDLSPLDVFDRVLLARAERCAFLLEHVFVGHQVSFDAVLFEFCGLLFAQLDSFFEQLRERKLHRRGLGSL